MLSCLLAAVFANVDRLECRAVFVFAEIDAASSGCAAKEREVEVDNGFAVGMEAAVCFAGLYFDNSLDSCCLNVNFACYFLEIFLA